MKEFKKDT